MIFLFATELEAQKFRDTAPLATIIICGVGMAECAATTAELIAKMKRQNKPQKLILAGIAGSYSLEDVALCEVVEVTSEEISAIPPHFATKYKTEAQTTLRTVSSNTVNQQNESKTTAQIENMEGAAFMAICAKANIEHLQIRAISNKVGDPFSLWQIDKACERLCEALCKI